MFSFSKQKRQAKLAGMLRRIADLTCPNLVPACGDSRSGNRYNRSLPALLAPWENDTFAAGECAYAVTKDVSDRGVALVLPQPFRAAEAVVGFWPATPHLTPSQSSPCFAVGAVRQNVEIGGGFWQLGVYLKDAIIAPDHLKRLTPLAAHLLPPTALNGRSRSQVLSEWIPKP
jgi:hypothetical protein